MNPCDFKEKVDGAPGSKPHTRDPGHEFINYDLVILETWDFHKLIYVDDSF